MKKIYFLLLAGIFLLSSTAFAQTSSYRKGELSINPGFALGLIGYGFGYYGTAGFAVPLSLNVNYGLTEQFSVGAYSGFMGRSYGAIGYRERLTSVSFGAQGAFHASPFLNEHFDLGLDEEVWDLYVRVILGLEHRRWSNEFNRSYYPNRTMARFGPVLGARYMFQPNLGLYAEGGRGTFGYLTVGLSFRI